MHYIIYWTSVLISLHSLHIVLDNPSNTRLLSFDIVLSIFSLYIWCGWGLAKRFVLNLF